MKKQRNHLSIWDAHQVLYHLDIPTYYSTLVHNADTRQVKGMLIYLSNDESNNEKFIALQAEYHNISIWGRKCILVKSEAQMKREENKTVSTTNTTK